MAEAFLYTLACVGAGVLTLAAAATILPALRKEHKHLRVNRWSNLMSLADVEEAARARGHPSWVHWAHELRQEFLETDASDWKRKLSKGIAFLVISGHWTLNPEVVRLAAIKHHYKKWRTKEAWYKFLEDWNATANPTYGPAHVPTLAHIAVMVNGDARFDKLRSLPDPGEITTVEVF